MGFIPFVPTGGSVVLPVPIVDGGTGQTAVPAAFTALAASGGTMGGALAMGANKVTGLADGSAATDAAAYGQIGGNWQAANQGLLTWAYDMPSYPSGGSSPLTPAGTMFTIAMKVPYTISVTNIVVILVTNGGTLTSGQCFGALYQGAGGALIGRTADQATAWGSGAPKPVTMALNGGPFNVTAGIVYVGLWYNGTTGPAFFRGNGFGAAVMNVGLTDAASRWGTANTGLTNAGSTPGTLGTITATGSVAAYWAGLS